MCTLLLAAALLSWPELTPDTRPWAYNWWMASAVDEDGLEAQCAAMEAAGMGGFHVIPIYGAKGHPGVDYLSPEWMRRFACAVRVAKSHGLGVDLTTGCGWCFGGPQLTAEQGCWKLQSTADDNPPYVTWSLTGQQVKRAGPGGRGPMMDPFSTSAMEGFLKPFAVFDMPGAVKPICFYHDSWEYFEAAWSPELFAAFQKKRGYDLRQHLRALSGRGDPDEVGRVRLDYRETLSDIVLDDVFPKWIKWCHDLGVETRNEAHGTMANWLDFYALADRPETEMYGPDNRDILISKFASSAAHVAGRKFVTSETGTWIGQHFGETLGEFKELVDRLFLAGVNHIYYHGLCYSPPSAPWPGWCFYAGAEMNPRNPIWRDVRFLNDYVARCQAMFQSCTPDADALLYWPLRDYWHDEEGFATPMTVHRTHWFYDQPIGDEALRLSREGVCFDYVSDRQLQRLDLSRYAEIVVPPCRYMPEATRAAIARFRQGRARREPFAAAGVGFTRFRRGSDQVYFLVNTNELSVTVRCPGATWMDPMTGKIRRVESAVDLSPHASGFLVVENSVNLRSLSPFIFNLQPSTSNLQPLTLSSPWLLTPICGGPDLPAPRTMTRLSTWSRGENGEEVPFSGTMLYTCQFACTNREPGEVVLSLGRVEQSARVRVNGCDVGFSIRAPHEVRFDASLLKEGANTLEVEVTSVGQNRLRDLGKRGIRWAYFEDANMMDYRNIVKKGSAPSGLRAETLPFQEYGLFGPVTLYRELMKGE